MVIHKFKSIKKLFKHEGYLNAIFFIFKILYKKLLILITPFEYQITNNLFNKSHYAYCCLKAANQAKLLGIKKISVIEFGCAGGKGLIALENIVKKIYNITNVKFEIYGFDSGKGLPSPKSYKDLKYHWKKGFYKVNKESLEQKLLSTKIIYGDVKNTTTNFFQKYKPAIVGCIFHDLDYYSSTKDSFKLFNQSEKYFLPRLFNYFDDIIGTEIELYNDWTGERLAINEFNHENKMKKFSLAYYLLSRSKTYQWYYQIRILHLFNHPKYNQFISKDNQQLNI